MAIPTIITNTNTTAPVRIFISCISLWDMPSNDTSIERCKERTEAAASAQPIFRSAVRRYDFRFFTFTAFTIASVTLNVVYAAMDIITTVL